MDNGVENGAPEHRPATALETDEVLRKIFSHLHTRDLKKCRLVCKQWNTHATKALEDRMDPVYLLHACTQCVGGVSERMNLIDDFRNLLKATAESGLELRTMTFKKFNIYFCHDKVSTVHATLSYDWVVPVVSLHLRWLTPQQFNECVLPILHRMRNLKHLGVNLQEDERQPNLLTAVEEVEPQHTVFVLESFEFTILREVELDVTSTGFLKQCKNLKALSLSFAYCRESANRIPIWFQAFRDPEYPRGITDISLQWGYKRAGVNDHVKIAEFLNLFLLENLQLHVTFSPQRRWDIINVLRSIDGRAIKKLALQLYLPSMGDTEKRRVLDVLRVLSLPQYRGLEDLTIGILDRTDRSASAPPAAVESGAIGEDFVLPGMKHLAVKFAYYYYEKGQVAILEMLKIANAKMPGLQSLSTDAFSAKAVKDAVKAAAEFGGLKELVLNGGDQTRKVRADITLFGKWDSERTNAFTGLLDLKELRSLTFIAPWNTELSKEAFERGFLRMPELRTLKINDNGLASIPPADLASLDLGNLSLERL